MSCATASQSSATASTSRPATSSWTNDSLITAMVGRTLENQFPKEFGTKGECMLKVENLSIGGVLNDVNFEAYGGQILGFAGLVGARSDGDYARCVRR